MEFPTWNREPVTSAEGPDAWRELALVVLGFGIVTVFLTFPLAMHLGSVARLDNADTQFLIWNVAWVARTLVVDPLHVFDTNVFYPHRWTLAYSESNLGAGILAIPVYWATANPYAAHNFALFSSFVLSATGTYYLVRYLVGDRRAAAIAALCFAYCPYLFGRIPHIHLLMTAGLPFSMLAFHRVADRPTMGRGAVLGLAVAAQALFCGYYGVFVGLTVAFAVLVIATTRRRWTHAPYWRAMGVAAIVAIGFALPLFLPYLRLQRDTGFARSIDQARHYSADWRAYLASSAYAHRWMLPMIRHWNEVLFPGFAAVILGVAGLGLALARGRFREIAILYGGLAAVALWASFGPDAGLYRVLYAGVPAFSFLRAAARFGMVVTFALTVLAGVAVSVLLARLEDPARVATVSNRRTAPSVSRRAGIVTVILAAAVVAELKVPLSFSTVPPTEPAYRVLAMLPRGPVIELPFFSFRSARQTQYMLSSTTHWMPLVNGYSSHIPRDFIEKGKVLRKFPSLEGFRVLERDGVRYVVLHLHWFTPDARDDLQARLPAFDRYLHLRYGDDRIRLYEIIDFPS